MNSTDPAFRLSSYVAALGLPEGFAERTRPTTSDKVEAVIGLRKKHLRRNYLLGVLIAYVGVAEKLLAQVGQDHLDDALKRYPPLEESGGRRLNTLTLLPKDEVISLRTYYNAVEQVIRHDLHRLGYPNAAPHATQSWSQHRAEFDLIAAMTPGERASLMDRLWDEALSLEEMGGPADGFREIRPFEKVLAEFPGGQRGEPGGAVLQGLAYAYYRADSPNVTLRIYKVGSGSSRVGAAGDVDGWIGDELALSVEVKDLDITDDNLSQFDQFTKQLERWPNCTAVALARSFTAGAAGWLLERTILPLDRDRMASNVSYWDVPKQRLAVRELLYFFAVVQVHAKLLKRFKDFCREEGIAEGPPGPGEAASGTQESHDTATGE
ncbi:MAG: hypothetical protein LBG60_11835 [Bifidobacteriaceae bacterium]|nr:hypothetical protein [Bifidobacteriaceae bacterium]